MSLACLAVLVLGTFLATLINDHLPIGGDYIDDSVPLSNGTAPQTVPLTIKSSN